MIAPDRWNQWIEILEEILGEADIGGASIFAIHIDTALTVARAAYSDKTNGPRHDPLPKEDNDS